MVTYQFGQNTNSVPSSDTTANFLSAAFAIIKAEFSPCLILLFRLNIYFREIDK